MKSTTKDTKSTKERGRLDCTLSIRFGHQLEREALDKAAKTAGQTFSEYCRRKLATPDFPAILDAVLSDASNEHGIEKHVLVNRILWDWAKPYLDGYNFEGKRKPRESSVPLTAQERRSLSRE